MQALLHTRILMTSSFYRASNSVRARYCCRGSRCLYMVDSAGMRYRWTVV